MEGSADNPITLSESENEAGSSGNRKYSSEEELSSEMEEDDIEEDDKSKNMEDDKSNNMGDALQEDDDDDIPFEYTLDPNPALFAQVNNTPRNLSVTKLTGVDVMIKKLVKNRDYYFTWDSEEYVLVTYSREGGFDIKNEPTKKDTILGADRATLTMKVLYLADNDSYDPHSYYVLNIYANRPSKWGSDEKTLDLNGLLNYMDGGRLEETYKFTVEESKKVNDIRLYLLPVPINATGDDERVDEYGTYSRYQKGYKNVTPEIKTMYKQLYNDTFPGNFESDENNPLVSIPLKGFLDPIENEVPEEMSKEKRNDKIDKENERFLYMIRSMFVYFCEINSVQESVDTIEQRISQQSQLQPRPGDGNSSRPPGGKRPRVEETDDAASSSIGQANSEATTPNPEDTSKNKSITSDTEFDGKGMPGQAENIKKIISEGKSKLIHSRKDIKYLKTWNGSTRVYDTIKFYVRVGYSNETTYGKEGHLYVQADSTLSLPDLDTLKSTFESNDYVFTRNTTTENNGERIDITEFVIPVDEFYVDGKGKQKKTPAEAATSVKRIYNVLYNMNNKKKLTLDEYIQADKATKAKNAANRKKKKQANESEAKGKGKAKAESEEKTRREPVFVPKPTQKRPKTGETRVNITNGYVKNTAGYVTANVQLPSEDTPLADTLYEDPLYRNSPKIKTSALKERIVESYRSSSSANEIIFHRTRTSNEPVTWNYDMKLEYEKEENKLMLTVEDGMILPLDKDRQLDRSIIPNERIVYDGESFVFENAVRKDETINKNDFSDMVQLWNVLFNINAEWRRTTLEQVREKYGKKPAKDKTLEVQENNSIPAWVEKNMIEVVKQLYTEDILKSTYTFDTNNITIQVETNDTSIKVILSEHTVPFGFIYYIEDSAYLVSYAEDYPFQTLENENDPDTVDYVFTFDRANVDNAITFCSNLLLHSKDSVILADEDVYGVLLDVSESDDDDGTPSASWFMPFSGTEMIAKFTVEGKCDKFYVTIHNPLSEDGRFTPENIDLNRVEELEDLIENLNTEHKNELSKKVKRKFSIELDVDENTLIFATKFDANKKELVDAIASSVYEYMGEYLGSDGIDIDSDISDNGEYEDVDEGESVDKNVIGQAVKLIEKNQKQEDFTSEEMEFAKAAFDETTKEYQEARLAVRERELRAKLQRKKELVQDLRIFLKREQNKELTPEEEETLKVAFAEEDPEFIRAINIVRKEKEQKKLTRKEEQFKIYAFDESILEFIYVEKEKPQQRRRVALTSGPESSSEGIVKETEPTDKPRSGTIGAYRDEGDDSDDSSYNSESEGNSDEESGDDSEDDNEEEPQPKKQKKTSEEDEETYKILAEIDTNIDEVEFLIEQREFTEAQKLIQTSKVEILKANPSENAKNEKAKIQARIKEVFIALLEAKRSKQ